MSDKVLVKLKGFRTIENPNSLSNLTKATVLREKKHGRKLDKQKVKEATPLHTRRFLKAKSIKNGYFQLEGFARYYQKVVKMSPSTLFRRMYNNKDVLQSLEALGYIERFYTSERFGNTGKEKIQFKIFRATRKEMLKFIVDNFLTESQRKQK